MISIIENFRSSQKQEHKKIESVLSNTMITTDYKRENVTVYHQQSSEYTTSVQSQSIAIDNLKRYLENLIEVGYELGLFGLFLFAKDLRKRFKTNQANLYFTTIKAQELFIDICQRLECLVDDILTNLYRLNLADHEILCSPKVLQLIERIIEQHERKKESSKCIVFVERVYTATMLSYVLSKLILGIETPWDTKLKVKHVTGIKAIFSNESMSAKQQVNILYL